MEPSPPNSNEQDDLHCVTKKGIHADFKPTPTVPQKVPHPLYIILHSFRPVKGRFFGVSEKAGGNDGLFHPPCLTSPQQFLQLQTRKMAG